MSFRFARYSNNSDHLDISNTDRRMYDMALAIANWHESGGTYNMVASWVKGKPKAHGYNRLDSPAHLKSDIYPELCGLHAELNLWSKRHAMRGGTVYVAGRLATSGSEMTTTQPCVYCAALLQSAGVRNAVYMLNSTLVKSRLEALVDGEICRDRAPR